MNKIFKKGVALFITVALMFSFVSTVSAVDLTKYDFFEIEKNIPYASTIGSTTKLLEQDATGRTFNSKALDNKAVDGYTYAADGTPLKVCKDANGNYVRKITPAASNDPNATFEGTYKINVPQPQYYKEISIMALSSYDYGDAYNYIKSGYNFTITYEDNTVEKFGPKEINMFTYKVDSNNSKLLASTTASYVLYEFDSALGDDKSAPWIQWNDTKGYIVNHYFDKFYVPVYKIPVNTSKKVKSIDVVSSQSSDYYQILMAVTAEKVDASTILASLTAKLPEELSEVNKDNYLEYKTLIEDIEKLDSTGALLTQEELLKIEEIKEIIAELNFDDFITLDFSQYFNAKIFAVAGQPVTDWTAENYMSSYLKVGDIYVPTPTRGLNKTAFENAKDADGLIYSNAKIPFDINTNGGVSFGGRTDPLKDEEIFFDGLYADKLHFVFPSNDKNNDKTMKNNIIVNYADGSSTMFNFNNYHGITSAPITENDYIGMTYLSINNAKGATYDQMRYIDVFEVDTEFEKPIVSVKFTTNDKYHGEAVVGITAELAGKSATKTAIESKIKKILQSNLSTVEPDINAVKMLIDHSEAYFETPIEGIGEFDALYAKYITSAAKVESAENKTDLENTVAEITFKNEMNKDELIKAISVTLNGTETKDYTATYENKTLTISFKNDLDYDKAFVLTIPSGITSEEGLALRNAYTYAFNAEEPIGYSTYTTEGSSVSLKLENYTIDASQPYLVTVAHIGTDGSFEKSYLIKGTLAKESSVTKNYTFDALAEGEKIVTYTLDSLASQKSISKEKGITANSSAEGILADALIVNPVNLTDNTVKIEGAVKSTKAGEKVNIIIVNPETSLTADGEYTDAIQNQISVLTAKNGYFSATLKLNNKESGMFKVYANGENDTFYFASTTAKNDLINDVLNSGNNTLIKGKLNEIYLNFGLDKYVPVTLSEDDVITDAIIKGAPYAENDFAGVQKVIQEAAVLYLYNSEKTDKVTDESLNFLYDDVTGFAGLDTAKNCTIYSAYAKILNTEGKKAVINSLTNKNFESIADLQTALLKSIFTKAVNMTGLLGTAHIKDVLTKANAAAINVNIDSYLASANSGKVDKDLAVAGEYADITALVSAISELVAKYPVTTPSGGGGGGGGGAAIGNVVTGVVGSVTNNNPVDIPAVEVNYGFSDISDTRWAEKAIDALVEKKVVSGFPDNTFRPNDGITREQIIKILCLINDIEPDYDYQFKFNDVNYDEWYAPYVNAAYKNKITLGIDEENFGIGNVVTRQDLVTMIYRLTNPEALKENKTFADQTEIAEYAKDAVNYFAIKGYVSGYEDGNFRPSGSCTRAEAVLIVYNVLGGGK